MEDFIIPRIKEEWNTPKVSSLEFRFTFGEEDEAAEDEGMYSGPEETGS